MRPLRAVLPVLITLAACHPVPASQPGRVAPVAGAPSARAAVAMYMTGMREGNYTIIGDIWGTREWLAREHYPQAEFEKRAFIASCYIGWDGYRITSARPGSDHSRWVTVRSTTRHEQATLHVVKSSRGRWFVEGFDASKLTPDRCRAPATTTAAR